MKFLSIMTAAYSLRSLLLAGFVLPAFPLAAQTNSAPATNAPPADGNFDISYGDPFADPLIKQVQARHDKAVKGDKKEAKALTADLEKWVEEQPNNFLLQAYLGSIYTVDSRDAWIGPSKLTFLRKGGQWLDGAVNSAPDNPAVRFVRAIDYYELPSIFGKAQVARDDFATLLKQIDGEVKSPYALNTETQQAIYFYAGKCSYQLSQYPQAKDAWVRGYKLAPNSVLGKQIGDELMKVK
jgi:hypothetical protein